MSLTHPGAQPDRVCIRNEVISRLGVPEAAAASLELGNGWTEHAVVHPLNWPSILGQSMQRTVRA